MSDLYYEGPIEILEHFKKHPDIAKEEFLRLSERGLIQLKATIEELKEAKSHLATLLTKEDGIALASHDDLLNPSPIPLSPLAHAYKNMIMADNLLYGFWEAD